MAKHPPLRQIIDGTVWYGVWNPSTNQYDWTAIGPGPATASRAKTGARAKAGARAKSPRKRK
jgi:hypothetical protein